MSMEPKRLTPERLAEIETQRSNLAYLEPEPGLIVPMNALTVLDAYSDLFDHIAWQEQRIADLELRLVTQATEADTLAAQVAHRLTLTYETCSCSHNWIEHAMHSGETPCLLCDCKRFAAKEDTVQQEARAALGESA